MNKLPRPLVPKLLLTLSVGCFVANIRTVVGVAMIYSTTRNVYPSSVRTRELEKTHEQLLATTEAGELQRREDARARRLATAREVRESAHRVLGQCFLRCTQCLCDCYVISESGLERRWLNAYEVVFFFIIVS